MVATIDFEMAVIFQDGRQTELCEDVIKQHFNNKSLVPSPNNNTMQLLVLFTVSFSAFV